MSGARVLVAMSGGVDSSVAAALLRDRGHDVTGVTLKLWGGDSDSGCCSVSDVEDARRVAAQLGIPHYVFNFTDDFTRSVVEPYVDAYGAGSTPNPCVECNRAIKFGRLLERSEALGFDFVATGHHARVCEVEGVFRLQRGADLAKDQSYVLYMLGQRELARTLLPVGDLTKREVRAYAARLGLRTATKPESMDVCFIGRGQRAQFVASRGTSAAGAIVDTAGAVVGAHDGIANFTVGQRRGVGVAMGERHYVVDVDATSATVTIGTRRDLLRDAVGAAVAHLRRRPTRVRRSPRAGSRARRAASREPARQRRAIRAPRSRASHPVRWSRCTKATRSWVAASPPERRAHSSGDADASRRGCAQEPGPARHREADLGDLVHLAAAPGAPGAHDLGRLVEAEGDGAGGRAEPQVGHAGRSRRGIDRAHRHNALAQEEDGVGQRERVDDHEPRGHEHAPPA